LEKPGRTMLAKIWEQHVVTRISEDTDLLHIDRHLLHDLGGSRGLLDLKGRGLKVHSPELTFATPDHAISTAQGRAGTSKIGLELLASLRVETSASGIQLFDVDQPGQGIVHVIGPELGLSLPGCTIVCGDSHTCTHGGLGALAFGIGSSELTHVLATQALMQRRPRTMRVRFEGKLPLGVTAKDLILALIGRVGAAGGTGYAVEYAGSAIRGLSIEGRLTVCNLSIELGAKMGMVAPDEKTFEFLRGRPYAPQGEMWDRAVSAWRQLPSDPDAIFDKEVVIDVEKIIPQVTWGISPEHVIGIDGYIPDPQMVDDPARRAAIETAFVRAHRDLLAVIAWFVVLPGPAGAVLYKLSSVLAEKWGRRTDEEFGAFGRFSAKAFYVLDWVPLRLTAIGFAIAGDFEDAMACWRAQAQTWPDQSTGVILASGAGALDVRLGGPLSKEGGVNFRSELGTGDDPDGNYMQSAAGLIWRTLVIWMIVLLLLTIARWVGT